MSALRGQLVHWSRSLGRLNRSDLPNDNSVYTALSKFRITIDYICREAAQFDKKYHFESEKSKRIVEELAKLTTEAVLKLVEYSRSIEVYIYKYIIYAKKKYRTVCRCRKINTNRYILCFQDQVYGYYNY